MEVTNVPSISAFLNHLKYRRHLAPATLRGYAADLLHYCLYLLDQTELIDAVFRPRSTKPASTPSARKAVADLVVSTTELNNDLLDVNNLKVRAFLATLDDGEFSLATKARRLATLKSFYKTLVRLALMESNPIANLSPPKQESSPRRIVDVTLIEALLAAPEITKWYEARDLAFLLTLVSSGISIKELEQLNIGCIAAATAEGATVEVVGKDTKVRKVRIGAPAVAAIIKSLEIRPCSIANVPVDPNALWLNKYGQRLSSRSMRRRLGKYLIRAKLPTSISLQVLRNSYAAQLIESGVAINVVQAEMGHRSKSTTDGYHRTVEIPALQSATYA